MRTVYVVTHAEATHHVQALVGGWYDAALTPRGEDHARRVAVALDSRIPTGEAVQVFSSDLRRTRQTAEPIAATLGVDVAIDAGLREQSYGDAEGQPAGTLRFLPPPAVGDRLHHHDGVNGSETRWDVATRVYAAMDRVLAAPAQRLVVVTHGGAATFLIAAWIGMPIESVGYVKFRTTPAGITELVQHDDVHDRQVTALNDISHLD